MAVSQEINGRIRNVEQWLAKNNNRLFKEVDFIILQNGRAAKKQFYEIQTSAPSCRPGIGRILQATTATTPGCWVKRSGPTIVVCPCRARTKGEALREYRWLRTSSSRPCERLTLALWKMKENKRIEILLRMRVQKDESWLTVWASHGDWHSSEKTGQKEVYLHALKADNDPRWLGALEGKEYTSALQSTLLWPSSWLEWSKLWPKNLVQVVWKCEYSVGVRKY